MVAAILPEISTSPLKVIVRFALLLANVLPLEVVPSTLVAFVKVKVVAEPLLLLKFMFWPVYWLRV